MLRESIYIDYYTFDEMSGFADLKAVGRPSCFDGNDDHWMEWSFQATAFIVMSGISTRDELTASASAASPISVPTDATEVRRSASLYYFLALQCKGRAQLTIRGVPAGQGWEAWRMLNRLYDRSDCSSTLGMLQAILSFSRGTSLDGGID